MELRKSTAVEFAINSLVLYLHHLLMGVVEEWDLTGGFSYDAGEGHGSRNIQVFPAGWLKPARISCEFELRAPHFFSGFPLWQPRGCEITCPHVRELSDGFSITFHGNGERIYIGCLSEEQAAMRPILEEAADRISTFGFWDRFSRKELRDDLEHLNEDEKQLVLALDASTPTPKKLAADHVGVERALHDLPVRGVVVPPRRDLEQERALRSGRIPAMWGFVPSPLPDAKLQLTSRGHLLANLLRQK